MFKSNVGQEPITIAKRLSKRRQCKFRHPNQEQNFQNAINVTVPNTECCIRSEKEMKKEIKCQPNKKPVLQKFLSPKHKLLVKSETKTLFLANPTDLYTDEFEESLSSPAVNMNDPMFLESFFSDLIEDPLDELESCESASEKDNEDQEKVIKSVSVENGSVLDKEKQTDLSTMPQSIRYLAVEQREFLVALTIGAHQVIAKIDTGSSGSYMSQELADTIRDSIKIQQLHPQILTLDNCTLQGVKEEVITKLKVCDKIIELRALILADAANDLILGMDFLNATEAIFIFGGQQIKLGQSKYTVLSESVPPQVVASGKEESAGNENSQIKKNIKSTSFEREYQRSYREANKDVSREYQRKYRELHKKKNKFNGVRNKLSNIDYQKQYRERNKEKLLKYREMKKNK